MSQGVSATAKLYLEAFCFVFFFLSVCFLGWFMEMPFENIALILVL